MAKIGMTGDDMLNIAIGNVLKYSSVNKFGRSLDVDSGDDTDIWDLATQAIWIPPTQARIHAIVSTSANDTLLGVGARTIKIYGLTTWSTKEVSETIELNGATPVNTANSYVIIHRMKVTASGATAINSGILTATAATDGTITAQIVANEGQTQMAIYGIPSNLKAYMKKYYVSAIKAASSLGVEVKLLVNTAPDSQVLNYLVKHTIGIATEGTNYASHLFEPYFGIQGPAIIKIQANSSANNTDVSAGFDLILIDN